MSEDHASPIPGKLRDEGFAVVIDRMDDPQGKRLWCASATRDGAKWSAFGEELNTVLSELERQTLEEDGDWLDSIADEMLETARTRLQAGSSSRD